MTDPKGIASLVSKRITNTAPQGEGGDADGAAEKDAPAPEADDDIGMEAASEELVEAFQAGDAKAVRETLVSLIELTLARRSN